jgi:hypothetical protein
MVATLMLGGKEGFEGVPKADEIDGCCRPAIGREKLIHGSRNLKKRQQSEMTLTLLLALLAA